MPGLYIHIPFCRKACYYCDFHFTVSLKNKDALIGALIKEIEYKKNYLGTNVLDTLYIGGGTPSILSVHELKLIFDTIGKYFTLKPGAEISIEVNPDDCTDDYVYQMSLLPINRVSIGIQSFHDSELKLMNRRHTSKQAVLAVKRLKNSGFKNISVDLIYGIPGSDINTWKYNLGKTLELDVDHISLYHLTYEPKTIFTNWVKKQKLSPVDETISIHQFEVLIDVLEKNGYEQYEISNFARNKRYSKHNTSYWTGENYIGIGPSAHSYNGKTRSWNINVNTDYIAAINNNQAYQSIEQIDLNTRYNEYVMTSLRTIWGVNLNKIEKEFGSKINKHTLTIISKFEKSGDVKKDNNVVKLTTKGKFISDYIISEFFIV